VGFLSECLRLIHIYLLNKLTYSLERFETSLLLRGSFHLDRILYPPSIFNALLQTSQYFITTNVVSRYSLLRPGIVLAARGGCCCCCCAAMRYFCRVAVAACSAHTVAPLHTAAAVAATLLACGCCCCALFPRTRFAAVWLLRCVCVYTHRLLVPPVDTLGGQLLFAFDFSPFAGAHFLNAGGIVLANCLSLIAIRELLLYSRVSFAGC